MPSLWLAHPGQEIKRVECFRFWICKFASQWIYLLCNVHPDTSRYHFLNKVMATWRLTNSKSIFISCCMNLVFLIQSPMPSFQCLPKCDILQLLYVIKDDSNNLYWYPSLNVCWSEVDGLNALDCVLGLAKHNCKFCWVYWMQQTFIMSVQNP